jgi:hypothetical protein
VSIDAVGRIRHRRAIGRTAAVRPAEPSRPQCDQAGFFSMVCATGGTIGSASAGSRGGSVEGAVQKLGIGVLDLREAGDERSGGFRWGAACPGTQPRPR